MGGALWIPQSNPHPRRETFCIILHARLFLPSSRSSLNAELLPVGQSAPDLRSLSGKRLPHTTLKPASLYSGPWNHKPHLLPLPGAACRDSSWNTASPQSHYRLFPVLFDSSEPVPGRGSRKSLSTIKHKHHLPHSRYRP